MKKSIFGQEIVEKEQKFIPEEKKINESLKTKPIDNSFQKQTKNKLFQ